MNKSKCIGIMLLDNLQLLINILKIKSSERSNHKIFKKTYHALFNWFLKRLGYEMTRIHNEISENTTIRWQQLSTQDLSASESEIFP